MGWKQGQEEIILDYMTAGQKSSLGLPPIAQPCLGILTEGSRGGMGADGAAGWEVWVSVWEPGHSTPSLLTESTTSQPLPRTGTAGPAEGEHASGL